MDRVAVVTGANRGLGLETTRQLLALGWTVVLTARSAEKARQAAAGLGPSERLHHHPLDLDRPEDATALAAFVQQRFGRLDALVNNAAAIFEPAGRSDPTAVDPEHVRRSFDNNVVGTLVVTQALAPLLIASSGNVVNVSSGMGSLAEMGGGWTGYRLSKAALNALTRVLHVELGPRGVRVNSVCPGWVRTEMGGAGADREVDEGASGIVWAATLQADGPAGGFFRDGQPVPW